MSERDHYLLDAIKELTNAVKTLNESQETITMSIDKFNYLHEKIDCLEKENEDLRTYKECLDNFLVKIGMSAAYRLGYLHRISDISYQVNRNDIDSTYEYRCEFKIPEDALLNPDHNKQ